MPGPPFAKVYSLLYTHLPKSATVACGSALWYDTAKRGLLHEIAVFCSARPAAGPDGLRRAGGRRDLPDTVQVEKTQTAETAVLYEDADGREVSPRRAALTEWRWSVADDTIAEVDSSGIVTGLRGRLDHPDAAKRRRENFRQLPGAGVQPAARHCFGRLHAVF